MSDGTHECPAPGCEERVPFHRLACPKHWYALPKPLRDALWRAYRERYTREGGFEAHLRVVRECVLWLEETAA